MDHPTESADVRREWIDLLVVVGVLQLTNGHVLVGKRGLQWARCVPVAIRATEAHEVVLDGMVRARATLRFLGTFPVFVSEERMIPPWVHAARIVHDAGSLDVSLRRGPLSAAT